jgi:hypothetical protein
MSNTAIISKNIFYVTGIISVISALLLIWQKKKGLKFSPSFFYSASIGAQVIAVYTKKTAATFLPAAEATFPANHAAALAKP